MSETRRPHAIHTMRRRSNAVSKVALACGEAASEAARLLGESIEMGGSFQHEVRAAQIIEGVIADLRMISVEAAVAEFEPGHTQRKRSDAEPSPTLDLEAA